MRTVPAILALLATSAQAVPACSMHSPAHRVALVELYTSEGCSSCPPADAFLSGLHFNAAQAVPLSLHVDYWNDIGWKDPFSSKTYTERQRWLSNLAGSRTVYTPEFFVGGKELRGWQERLAESVARANREPAQADIRIVLTAPQAGALAIDVQARAAAGGRLYVALVESSLASQVRAGENQGRLLRHDHVVRAWLPPVTLAPGAEGALVRSVPLPAGAVPGKLAVSAFVQAASGDVLQAATLPWCGG